MAIGVAAVVLVVYNFCGIGPEALTQAQRYASEIYELIGVPVVWITEGTAPPPDAEQRLRFQVALLGPAGNVEGVSKSALGVAPLSHDRAYIFCERVAALAPRAETSFATILGRVLAHEVGHLLLPGQGHAVVGIMRPNVDYASKLPPRFTDVQADSIRALIADRTVGALAQNSRGNER